MCEVPCCVTKPIRSTDPGQSAPFARISCGIAQRMTSMNEYGFLGPQNVPFLVRSNGRRLHPDYDPLSKLLLRNC